MRPNATLVAGLRLAAAAALVVCLGCAGSHSKPPLTAAESSGAPCWVKEGGRCFFKAAGKTKVISGVGSVGGTRNAGLARDAALGRARVDLARTLQVQVEAMLKDYQATTTGGGEFGSSAADEQHIVDVSKQITNLTLAGSELADSWVSRGGTTYVLCRLDVDGFKDAVGHMSSLSEAVRQAVIQRADRAFEDLDREVEPQGGRDR